MKRYQILIIMSISFCGLISCHCKTCADNITDVNKKIPYRDTDLVAFVNDTLGLIYDTVWVSLGQVSKDKYDCYGSAGDAESKYCSTFSEIDYSNYFQLQIVQQPNSAKNRIVYGALNPFSYYGWKIDTLSYIFKNDYIKAIHFYIPIDTFGSQMWKTKDSLWFVFNDYYYTTDKSIKLLQYSRVYKDGKRRVFKLKE
jgi:hypothetical protein